MRLLLILILSLFMATVSPAQDTKGLSAPQSKDDGWTTASAESVKLSAAALMAMASAIRAGEFKKVTSVLIARQGRLVYEEYFDMAGAAGFRNTRSATKTVTGMLVGLAIDKQLLSGVDVPVMSFFRDKQPVQNPDRARTKSQSKIF